MSEEQKQENAGTTPAVVATETTTVAAFSDADLGKVRELVIKANPDVVGDLVNGGSVEELLASVEPARAAYQQIADKVRGSNSGAPAATEGAPAVAVAVATPPVVPAGGTSAAVVEPEGLSPTTKIAQALAARRKK